MIRLNNLFFFVSKKRKQTMNVIGEEAEFEKRETAFVFKQKKDGNDNDGGGKGKKRSKSFIWFVIHTSHHITSPHFTSNRGCLSSSSHFIVHFCVPFVCFCLKWTLINSMDDKMKQQPCVLRQMLISFTCVCFCFCFYARPNISALFRVHH